MSETGPDEFFLVIEGVHHHHIAPTDDDGTDFAAITASIFNNGTDPESFVSVDVYEPETGQKFTEFHFGAEYARSLAHRLLAAADGLDLHEKSVSP